MAPRGCRFGCCRDPRDRVRRSRRDCGPPPGMSRSADPGLPVRSTLSEAEHRNDRQGDPRRQDLRRTSRCRHRGTRRAHRPRRSSGRKPDAAEETAYWCSRPLCTRFPERRCQPGREGYRAVLLCGPSGRTGSSEGRARGRLVFASGTQSSFRTANWFWSGPALNR